MYVLRSLLSQGCSAYCGLCVLRSLLSELLQASCCIAAPVQDASPGCCAVQLSAAVTQTSLLCSPQGNALDMMQDVNTGIAWVLRHAPAFGGDGKSFHIVGQSVSWLGACTGMAAVVALQAAAPQVDFPS